ncbi:hypothetical protein ACFYSC_32225 [Streptosporangium sp. NPDC004379]|uniref:hypothetical protein n=1 Tax=Streptosporangium sp. NPDC004379 TaxID=3366189 RepID=UPI00368FBA5F
MTESMSPESGQQSVLAILPACSLPARLDDTALGTTLGTPRAGAEDPTVREGAGAGAR